MGCNEAVLPNPLLKNCTINSLTFEENARQIYDDNLGLFKDFSFHLHGNQRLEEETSEIFNSFTNRVDGLRPNQFTGVKMDDIAIVQDVLILNILHYYINNANGNMIRGLARGILKKYEFTACCWDTTNKYVMWATLMQSSIRCPICNTFFSRVFNLDWQLTTCSERVRNIYTRNVYQIRNTLFDKLAFFGINWTSRRKLFKNLAIFNFESICVPQKTFKGTKTTTYRGEHAPISVSIPSNFCGVTNFSLLLSSSSPRFIFYWSTERSGVAKWSTNETFLPLHRDSNQG